MESIDPVERRAHRRAPLDFEIEVIPVPDNTNRDADLSVTVCRGQNVSGGGVSFVGTRRYQKDSLLRLSIPLFTISRVGTPKTDSKTILNVMGKVRWCDQNGDSVYSVTGVQFLNIYEQDFQILEDYVRNTLLS